ncbi:hypothetical protein SLNSH_05765 [Alsobacter soli]|uniref:Uncharacterized protein n=1 Tax=Alsobacter soli TaxID=2109933 RepID=A0A2T1HWC9_9HYPH|nr:hypothetical protein [Alsobacter soli]PSC05888.1 hypothetical protein SLNSH_05765 [Alsobacter soli]
MHFPRLAPVLACLPLLAASPAWADGMAPRAPATPACPDYGSFAVVDPPGGGRGRITAESLPGCPDLPGQRPAASVNVDVMVGIGSGQNAGTSSNAQGGGGGGLLVPTAPLPVLNLRPRTR